MRKRSVRTRSTCLGNRQKHLLDELGGGQKVDPRWDRLETEAPLGTGRPKNRCGRGIQPRSHCHDRVGYDLRRSLWILQLVAISRNELYIIYALDVLLLISMLLIWLLNRPTESTKPTGPVGPVGPLGPLGPVGPVGPMGPVGPVGPDNRNIDPVYSRVGTISSFHRDGGDVYVDCGDFVRENIGDVYHSAYTGIGIGFESLKLPPGTYRITSVYKIGPSSLPFKRNSTQNGIRLSVELVVDKLDSGYYTLYPTKESVETIESCVIEQLVE